MRNVRRPLLFAAALSLPLLAAALSRAEEPPKAAAPTAAASAAAPAATAAATAAAAPPFQPRTHSHESAAPPSAFNPRANKVVWDDRWAKFRTSEYVATGLFGAAVFVAGALPTAPDRWRDVSSFDAGARNALRLSTHDARNAADAASDLILTLMINQLVVDAALVAWWGHDRFTVGYQMVLIDLETLAFTGGVQSLVAGLASRWRPYRDTCVGPLQSQTNDCQENKQFRSFFSGHTSGAFATAGLMCMHHAHIPLYGGGAREVVACAASFAAAATVGMLRVASDQHFMSDMLVGAAFGTLSGLGIPWLLHYRTDSPAPDARAGARPERGLSVNIVPTPMGLAATGEF